MRDFINNIVLRLGSRDAQDLEEVLLATAFLFEKSRGDFSSYGLSPDVQSIEMLPDDVARLKESLIGFISECPQHPNIASAIWALGKLMDPGTKDALIVALRQQLDHNPDALYQAMIGLENINERVFEPDLISIYDKDENRRMAKAYLERGKSSLS